MNILIIILFCYYSYAHNNAHKAHFTQINVYDEVLSFDEPNIAKTHKDNQEYLLKIDPEISNRHIMIELNLYDGKDKTALCGVVERKLLKDVHNLNDYFFALVGNDGNHYTTPDAKLYFEKDKFFRNNVIIEVYKTKKRTHINFFDSEDKAKIYMVQHNIDDLFLFCSIKGKATIEIVKYGCLLPYKYWVKSKYISKNNTKCDKLNNNDLCWCNNNAIPVCNVNDKCNAEINDKNFTSFKKTDKSPMKIQPRARIQLKKINEDSNSKEHKDDSETIEKQKPHSVPRKNQTPTVFIRNVIEPSTNDDVVVLNYLGSPNEKLEFNSSSKTSKQTCLMLLILFMLVNYGVWK